MQRFAPHKWATFDKVTLEQIYQGSNASATSNFRSKHSPWNRIVNKYIKLAYVSLTNGTA